MYEEVRKSLHSIGVSPKLEPFNRRILSILASTSLGVISLWIFLFHGADSAEEYMKSVCLITICTGTLLSFASTILIKKELFAFIKSHDECFDERK